MNFKRFHESKNLFDASTVVKGRINANTGAIEYPEDTTAFTYDSTNNEFTITTSWAWRGFVSDYIDVQEFLQFSCVSDKTLYQFEYAYDNNRTFLGRVASDNIPTGTKYIRVSFQFGEVVTNAKVKNIMLNLGSEPLPYEPYSSEVWHSTPHYIHNTSTDTITTLPAVLYPNDTTATVGLKGNTLQSSIPSPTSPVMPQGTGDLETSGTKAGQYKIPILNNSQTTNVYLGEVQTTRKIKKLVLDGTENWTLYNGNYYSSVTDRYSLQNTPCRCTHTAGGIIIDNGSVRLKVFASRFTAVASNLEEWKTYLQQQYQNGTPVTVWYVLANEETGIVNEPLRKIGDYADEVSGITIPTTAGANTISVDTTLQPSEVSATYHGWHPVQSAHNRTAQLYDKDLPFSETGKFLKDDGTIDTSNVFNITEYIECDASTDYSLSNVNVTSNTPSVCYYDSSKNYISGKRYGGNTGVSFTTPNTCKYVKFSVRTDKLNEAMFNVGSEALPYEPYWN